MREPDTHCYFRVSESITHSKGKTEQNTNNPWVKKENSDFVPEDTPDQLFPKGF